MGFTVGVLAHGRLIGRRSTSISALLTFLAVDHISTSPTSTIKSDIPVVGSVSWQVRC